MSTGRPLCPVNKEQINFLMKSGFKNTKISKILGISRSTLYRRLSLFNVSDRKQQNGDEEIDNILLPLINEMPNSGEVYIAGILKARQIYIPRQRLRDRLKVLDPTGILMRKKNTIHRRVYKVQGPNCLWYLPIYIFLLSYINHAKKVFF